MGGATAQTAVGIERRFVVALPPVVELTEIVEIIKAIKAIDGEVIEGASTTEAQRTRTRYTEALGGHHFGRSGFLRHRLRDNPALLSFGQPLAYYLQRNVGLLLLSQDPTKTFDIDRRELPVARRGPLWFDETLTFKESDLGDRDVRELDLQRIEGFADREIRPIRWSRWSVCHDERTGQDS